MNIVNTDSVEKQNTVTWETINWRKVERVVFKLQKRIYKAVRCGNVKQARKLQKTLRHSWYNKLLAVRAVTQDNRGKKTAGVDGVKSLKPEERLELAKTLKLTGKAKPTRRVWIPKPGKDEKRPLGIPTMYDRALQGVLKNTIEPEWEGRFEPNSYGFRPGRKAQDAIAQIKLSIQHKPKYVLDADIAKCFDKIDHQALLRKTEYKGSTRRLFRAWLRAGVIDSKQFLETNEGTPQGGVISPLLANIALHGLEEIVKQYAETIPPKMTGLNKPNCHSKIEKRKSLTFIRYADDFVILHNNKEVIIQVKAIITEWLKGIGLELKPEKTRIAHTLLSSESEDNIAGFDFLGYNVRQFPAGKYKTGMDRQGKGRKDFITILAPNHKSITRHYDAIKKKCQQFTGAPQEKIIKDLNPIIRGWSNYYTFSDAATTGIFSKLIKLTYLRLRRWAKRKGVTGNDCRKYWHTVGNNNWVFGVKNDLGEVWMRLLNHGEEHGANSTDYVKVKGDKSPYDGDLVYWSSRLGRHPELSKTKTTLLKKQKGKCAHCGLYFLDRDIPTMEVDHITPKSLGGKDSYENFQLLHGHCHDEKTRDDGSLTKGLLTHLENREKVARDNNTTKVEENTQDSGHLTPAQRSAINWVKQMVDLFHETKLLKEEEYAFFKKYAEWPNFDEQGKPIALPPEYWEQGAKIVTCMMQEKRYKNYF